EVENFEDPLEADQGRHDIDLKVRQRGDRPVEPVEVCGERHDGADAERTGDRHKAADAVDHCGGQGGQQAERGHEYARVHRGTYADIADPGGPLGELGGLRISTTEDLGKQRTGHVEALGHDLAHVGG